MRARDEVLARIRAARPTEPVAVVRRYAVTAPDVDAIALLVDRLADYRARVRRCEPDEVAAVVSELLADSRQVVAPPGLPSGWLAAYAGPVRRDGDPEPLTVTDLDQPGVAVVTGCTVAIAETGTLVLDGSADQGRRLLTLVPDHHICVVRADQIVAGVPQALTRLPDVTRPLTLISGPSATSDIELQRVEGVHGPRHLDVVVAAA